jgi:putative membrane protein
MDYQTEINLVPAFGKNDRAAKWLILSVSFIVFIAVAVLSKTKADVKLSFDVHVFALVNAVINSLVSILLISGLVAAKRKKYLQHKRLMTIAIFLSVLFLVSYIAHHLLAGETKFGDVDHNGILSESEKSGSGSARYTYYLLLLTHIPLAAIILPFILFTAYRALTGEYEKHRKLSKITWPIWLYVSVSGVLIYWMIHPYYA